MKLIKHLIFLGISCEYPNYTEKKEVTLLNPQGFRGLKKGFVHCTEPQKGFVHCTEPKKGFENCNEFETLFGVS
jgi:hypothetical protein